MKTTKTKKAFNSLDGIMIAFFVILFIILTVTALREVSWGSESLTVTVTADRVSDGFLPEIKAGDKLYAADGTLIGTVVRYDVSAATEVYADTRINSENNWIITYVDVPKHSKLTVTVLAEADSVPGGYSVNGISVKVNKAVDFCINGFSAKGYFSSIGEVKQNEE